VREQVALRRGRAALGHAELEQVREVRLAAVVRARSRRGGRRCALLPALRVPAAAAAAAAGTGPGTLLIALLFVPRAAILRFGVASFLFVFAAALCPLSTAALLCRRPLLSTVLLLGNGGRRRRRHVAWP